MWKEGGKRQREGRGRGKKERKNEEGKEGEKEERKEKKFIAKWFISLLLFHC